MYDGPDLPTTDLPEDHTGLEPSPEPLDETKISTQILGYETTCHGSRGSYDWFCGSDVTRRPARFQFHTSPPQSSPTSALIQISNLLASPQSPNLHIASPFPIFNPFFYSHPSPCFPQSPHTRFPTLTLLSRPQPYQSPPLLIVPLTFIHLSPSLLTASSSPHTFPHGPCLHPSPSNPNSHSPSPPCLQTIIIHAPAVSMCAMFST